MDDHDDLVQRLQSLGMQPIDPARQSADLTAMAGVQPLRRGRPKLRTAVAVVAGLLVASSGLAAADVLPDPAQHAAHAVLARVGVDVPNPARYYDSGVCGPDEEKNHGAYVSDDHSLAGSDCGKPIYATDNGAGHGSGTPGPDDACHGKPSWAGDTSLTKEERQAAVAARAAECGDTEVTEQSDDEGTEPESTSPPTGAGLGRSNAAGRAEGPPAHANHHAHSDGVAA